VTNCDWAHEEQARKGNALQRFYSTVHIEADMRREMRTVSSFFCFCVASKG